MKNTSETLYSNLLLSSETSYSNLLLSSHEIISVLEKIVYKQNEKK